MGHPVKLLLANKSTSLVCYYTTPDAQELFDITMDEWELKKKLTQEKKKRNILIFLIV